MAVTVPYSLSALKKGAIAADGGMGTALTSMGDPVRDTCTITQADPTKTPFNKEIANAPYFVAVVPGEKTLAADFYCESGQQIENVCGGTFTPGVSPAPGSWKPGSADPEMASLELTMKDGSKVELARCSITYTLEWKFQRSGLPLIHLTADILDPIDPATGEPHATAQWINVIDAPAA